MKRVNGAKILNRCIRGVKRIEGRFGANDTFCEADQALPDGKSNYDINNCDDFDVFRCTRGNVLYL